VVVVEARDIIEINEPAARTPFLNAGYMAIQDSKSQKLIPHDDYRQYSQQ